MLVVPELPVYTVDLKQIGWFKTRPSIDPMPEVDHASMHGMVIMEVPGIKDHPNFTPIV